MRTLFARYDQPTADDPRDGKPDSGDLMADALGLPADPSPGARVIPATVLGVGTGRDGGDVLADALGLPPDPGPRPELTGNPSGRIRVARSD